jgi:hypothetical protein
MDVERRLRGALTLTPAPEGLWEGIGAELARPASEHRRPWTRRRVNPWLAAATVILAVALGMLGGTYRAYRAPTSWSVQAVAGAPRVDGARLAGTSTLTASEWLVTDANSRAVLTVGRIGTAEVGPNSQVRIDKGGVLQHRLTLERGLLHAVIEAPPRLFFVRTPSALATDLGCAYTMEVDSVGNTRIHVTAGWVELEEDGVRSLIPAGLVAEVASGSPPGIPYPENFPADARAALRRLEMAGGDGTDLATVSEALSTPSDAVTRRKQSGIVLWHLVQRVRPALRARVFDQLAALSPPPDGVTREEILALQRPILERWRRDLNPMWSEEAMPWWGRLGRGLWEWAVE